MKQGENWSLREENGIGYSKGCTQAKLFVCWLVSVRDAGPKSPSVPWLILG